MNKAELERMLEEAGQKARGERKPFRTININNVRLVLNTIFLIGAAAGVTLYFLNDDNRWPGIITVGAAMIVKVIEFIIRLLA